MDELLARAKRGQVLTPDELNFVRRNLEDPRSSEDRYTLVHILWKAHDLQSCELIWRQTTDQDEMVRRIALQTLRTLWPSDELFDLTVRMGQDPSAYVRMMAGSTLGLLGVHLPHRAGEAARFLLTAFEATQEGPEWKAYYSGLLELAEVPFNERPSITQPFGHADIDPAVLASARARAASGQASRAPRRTVLMFPLPESPFREVSEAAGALETRIAEPQRELATRNLSAEDQEALQRELDAASSNLKAAAQALQGRAPEEAAAPISIDAILDRPNIGEPLTSAELAFVRGQLDDPESDEDRFTLIQLLWDANDLESHERIWRQTTHPDGMVRRIALQALRTLFPCDEVFDLALRMAQDPSEAVRRAVGSTLGTLAVQLPHRKTEAARFLLDAFEHHPTQEGDEWQAYYDGLADLAEVPFEKRPPLTHDLRASDIDPKVLAYARSLAGD